MADQLTYQKMLILIISKLEIKMSCHFTALDWKIFKILTISSVGKYVVYEVGNSYQQLLNNPVGGNINWHYHMGKLHSNKVENIHIL